MYIPILCLIPFLLIVISKENIQYNKLRLTTFLIGLGLIIFSETTIKFISRITTQNLILIFLPIIFSFIIYIYLFKKFKIKLAKAV